MHFQVILEKVRVWRIKGPGLGQAYSVELGRYCPRSDHPRRRLPSHHAHASARRRAGVSSMPSQKSTRAKAQTSPSPEVKRYMGFATEWWG